MKVGAWEGARTPDLTLTRRLLYQLSYPGEVVQPYRLLVFWGVLSGSPRERSTPATGFWGCAVPPGRKQRKGPFLSRER